MITSNEYDKIIKGDKEMKDSVENKFYIWLSGKIPASQVSDYFLIYQEINNICLQKLMVGRLFDIFDVVLLNKIKNNIINEACSNKAKIEKALTLYAKYIESHYDDINDYVVETNSTSTSAMLDVADKVTDSEITEKRSETSEVQTNDYVLDFMNIGNLSYTRPTSLKIFGIDHTEVNNWTNLYVMIVSLLYEKYPTLIKALKNQSPSSGKCDISDKYGARFMFAPKQFAYDLYVETNFSATNICKKIHKLLDVCNVSYDDVEIRYVKRSNTSTFGHQTNFFHRESNILPHSQTTNSEINRYENIDSTLYYEILKAKFPRGFRLNDKLDIKKFRKYWKELCNEENPLSNECIWDYISHITIAHGKMSYLPEMMIDEETKTELINYIEETFSNGKTAIYYEALYQTFRDELDKGRINNAEMLKTYLEYTTKNKYFLQKTYITIDSKAKVDATDEVRRFLKSYEMPMTTENIIEGLPHLDKDKITFALSGNNSYEFVRNQKGEYFHADIIEFTDSEIARIEQWISDSITQNEYMSSKELTSLIDRYLPEIHERYTFLTELGLRDTIAYKLRGKFSFKSKIISKYGEDLNMDKVFTRFGKNHTPFSMEQLNALKDELGTTIYFDSLYRCAMRVSKNEFVSRDYADFDISATDDVIGQLCTGDFISLKDVTLFGGFPSCGYTWNSYLLEYYIMYFSEKFKLLHTSFNMNSSVGAIVKKNAGIETFDDVLVKALAESSIALITDDALNYLCESGLLARRSYSTIDNIVSRAKTYRAKKGE